MKTKELAALLHGHEVGDLPPELDDVARRSGLVVVIGSSDDMVTFYGAVRGEADVPEGGTIYFDADGILPEPDEAPADELRAYYDRKRLAVSIDANWQVDGFDWTFSSIIPHSRFVLAKAGERYCRAICLKLLDAGISLDA